MKKIISLVLILSSVSGPGPARAGALRIEVPTPAAERVRFSQEAMALRIFACPTRPVKEASATFSELELARRKYVPPLPGVLRHGPLALTLQMGKLESRTDEQQYVARLFPLTADQNPVTFIRGASRPEIGRKVKVGMVLSGGQAPGGHSAIAGIFEAVKKANPQSTVIGFLNGPSGIIKNKTKEITAEVLANERNTGGFDLLGTDRTKIETAAQFEAAKKTIMEHELDVLVVIGGDDSNTNAAVLAEFFLDQFRQHLMPKRVSVIGVPKTIDGDLKNASIETSFGFDTATKIIAEAIGNLCRDALSAKKQWFFCRVMGRSASHIALEASLKTHANITLIGEEIKARNMTLAQVVDYMIDIITRRAAAGKNYGVAVIPEGLIEFIPEMGRLISAINDLMAKNTGLTLGQVIEELGRLDELNSTSFAPLLKFLPRGIQEELVLDRDPHGNVKVSQIETERMLLHMMKTRLPKLTASTHFFGYESRSVAPSNFDANYCFSLGYTAATLGLNGLTGYIASVRGLILPVAQWMCGGYPLTFMMDSEYRKGNFTPVIRKALVDLNGNPFAALAQNREEWAMQDRYEYPGAIQYFGPADVVDMVTRTLIYEQLPQIQDPSVRKSKLNESA